MSHSESTAITLGGEAGARHWDKEIYDKGKKCGHCKTYQMRVIFHDGDILDVACLCGYRSYMDQDGYSNRDWDTENVYRLFLLDTKGQAELHFFKDGFEGKSIRQQVAEFCKKWRHECPMMLPLDAIPGTNETLVATSLHMVEAFYNDFNTAIIMCHHFKGDDGSQAEWERYQRDMRDQDINPYEEMTPEKQLSEAKAQGFDSYEALLADFWKRPKSANA